MRKLCVMRKIAFLTAIGAMALACVPASASDYGFKLHNRAAGYTITGFYTYQNGQWSKNWLSRTIAPGNAVAMDWASNEGDCVVPFRVQWRDYGNDDYKIDWCKGVSNIYMKDRGFTSD